MSNISIVYASTVAKLDSNVRTGGGTDDTAALQAVLDRAKTEGGIHLIMDGAALVSHLEVYSNTTIECLNASCGFYQKDNSDCAGEVVKYCRANISPERLKGFMMASWTDCKGEGAFKFNCDGMDQLAAALS